MKVTKPHLKHVSYLWEEERASRFSRDEVSLLIYRSNLLGADKRLTNFGGGNTSCKMVTIDPLTQKETEVMWVKGSGGDLATLTRKGLAALYVDRMRSLRKIYRGLQHEDEMVSLFGHCIYDLDSAAPSIDTPAHIFLPFKHIDHLHADAAIAFAASKDGKQITLDVFDGAVGWVDWQRPGFDIALKLLHVVESNPGLRGIILASHGLFTWGETSYDCYLNSLRVIDRCSEYIDGKMRARKIVFGGTKKKLLLPQARKKKAALIAPILRGCCSLQAPMVGHFTDEDPVLEFLNSKDLDNLAPLGTSCPDHFLRTKIRPLILNLKPEEEEGDLKRLSARISAQFEAYREMYSSYYNECKHVDSPPMRDPNPVVILYPGVGIFTFARDKQTAGVAAEFYVNAINVMRGAEIISKYVALQKQEAFDIEYWLLEEAKLTRRPKPKALGGKVALVTGSAGGIGKAIARKFAHEGACVAICDNDAQRLERAADEFRRDFGDDTFIAQFLNVADKSSVDAAFEATSLAFCGVDIVVNCAGLSTSKPVEEYTEDDWNLLYNVMVKGQLFVTQSSVETMRKQNLCGEEGRTIGGDILNIVSKNALASGPNNAAYGSAKAAQLHLSRLNAAELGKDKIRVNAVNPDAVIVDSKIWSGPWAEGRAKAYGIAVNELPAYYAKRTLLSESIFPEDVANACYVFVSGMLDKSTGNILNVDGGVASAFVR